VIRAKQSVVNHLFQDAPVIFHFSREDRADHEVNCECRVVDCFLNCKHGTEKGRLRSRGSGQGQVLFHERIDHLLGTGNVEGCDKVTISTTLNKQDFNDIMKMFDIFKEDTNNKTSGFMLKSQEAKLRDEIKKADDENREHEIASIVQEYSETFGGSYRDAIKDGIDDFRKHYKLKELESAERNEKIAALEYKDNQLYSETLKTGRHYQKRITILKDDLLDIKGELKSACKKMKRMLQNEELEKRDIQSDVKTILTRLTKVSQSRPDIMRKQKLDQCLSIEDIDNWRKSVQKWSRQNNYKNKLYQTDDSITLATSFYEKNQENKELDAICKIFWIGLRKMRPESVSKFCKILGYPILKGRKDFSKLNFVIKFVCHDSPEQLYIEDIHASTRVLVINLPSEGGTTAVQTFGEAGQYLVNSLLDNYIKKYSNRKKKKVKGEF
jgi:hypothetical protein